MVVDLRAFSWEEGGWGVGGGCMGTDLTSSIRVHLIFGTPGPYPKKTTCSFSYRFRGKSGNSGVVPGNQGRNASEATWERLKTAHLPQIASERGREVSRVWPARGCCIDTKALNTLKCLDRESKPLIGCFGLRSLCFEVLNGISRRIL